MKSATLNPKEERRLIRGHLWAYRNEFKSIPELENGDLLDIFSAERRFVGRGFYQADGGIAVRLLSRRQEEIDQTFIADRVSRARGLRERLFSGSRVWRWVHAESDGLPGLVADRYDGLVCLKTVCKFYARRMEELAGVFLEEEGATGVCFVCGAEMSTFGTVPELIEVEIDGLRTAFPLSGAQKTGLFLDQRLNRAAIGPLAQGARVLDGHCYVGQWSCRAARAGAASVLGIDTSAWAVEEATANAARNGIQEVCRFECASIEEVLERGELYELIILDPPAFAKGRGQAENAMSRYLALNANAMRCLSPNGFLVTSSCSHFVDVPAFTEMLKRAAAAAKRQMLLLEMRGAAPDHPVMLSMPETAYLKCAFLRANP